ncbi:DUF3810 domain-containing protein [Mucilaginibacter phyllosphaerae]|uniref:DUF3810 domain-containing protein n=1 Tax=Mucilaginibacter phyllosphaerae TaxID=1812349 RepID=A0A4Y8AFM4_9SPHI|nr:DUF3810 domain-containing protein [Mucilaginibacter phyllosphaerae]MBB3968791.1 hypothetical protein [Mucilaginibacter phyllosphaerae]TEW67574.1 DUF3810 domain-containing protein [Mucilaginibacter phyllosphaerae]GGH13858.1 hypothetical protein GCM10007352_21600 [Mucilaginibacter phyllosphaerae]
MQQQKIRKTLARQCLIILGIILAINLLLVFSDHPQMIEKYYSQGFYPVICQILHPAFNWLPFSFGDVAYLLVIGYLIYALIRLVSLCFKKQFLRAGIFTARIITGVMAGIFIFYLFWGLNYFRPPAGERLNLRDSTYTKAELQRVTNLLIDSANATRARVTGADLKQNNDSIYGTAFKAVVKLSATSKDFSTYSPRIKPSLLTPLLNYIGTSGYYNPFTGEAQMNYQMPVFNRPFVACHEMSHQMGYGAEDEANFVGFLAATGTTDRLLRYSAYNLAVNEFMHTARYTDTVMFKQLKQRISPAVLADFKTERLYWLSYQNKIDTITSVFYDYFLKANNQPQGLETYNRMVLLVMAMYRGK